MYINFPHHYTFNKDQPIMKKSALESIFLNETSTKFQNLDYYAQETKTAYVSAVIH